MSLKIICPLMTLLVSFLYICNCSDRSLDKNFEKKKIILNKKNLNFKNSLDIFTMEKEIQLETKKECFIVEIKKVMVYDTFIVVIDHNNPLPHVFNEKGKFQHSIGLKGKGPGEIDNNVFTSMNDSILSILSFPQNVIYQYSVKNILMNTIDLNRKKLFFTKCFFSGNSYFLIEYGYNPQKSFLDLYYPDKEKVDKLWTIGRIEKDRLMKEYGSELFMSDFICSSNNNNLFITYDNEYKIHHWKSNTYQGYYTNDFDKYDFYILKKGMKYDDSFKIGFKDNIIGIYCLLNNYLFVNLNTRPSKRLKNWEKDLNVKYQRTYHVFDIINLKTNEIITGIENIIYNIVGNSDNMLIYTLPPVIINEESPAPPKDFYDPDKNPKLKFYRFHPEKLENKF